MGGRDMTTPEAQHRGKNEEGSKKVGGKGGKSVAYYHPVDI